jgi:hypothetical protein
LVLNQLVQGLLGGIRNSSITQRPPPYYPRGKAVVRPRVAENTESEKVKESGDEMEMV